MDEGRRKTKRLAIGLFLACLCAALACFGIFARMAVAIRGREPIDERMVTISKIVVMIGIFFLVLAFGYLLPSLISHRNRTKQGGLNVIFDEGNMRRVLGKSLPAGETLLAGIHAISQETSIKGIFRNCICMEDRLVPVKSGGTVILEKKKYSTYDIYMGITRNFLLINGCEQDSYYYQTEDGPGDNGGYAQEVTSELLLEDIGTCFPLTDIQTCTFKKGWMGSVKCRLMMKDGSSFKLLLPKLGGLGGGMPHHKEYREAIIARLGGDSPDIR